MGSDSLATGSASTPADDPRSPAAYGRLHVLVDRTAWEAGLALSVGWSRLTGLLPERAWWQLGGDFHDGIAFAARRRSGPRGGSRYRAGPDFGRRGQDWRADRHDWLSVRQHGSGPVLGRPPSRRGFRRGSWLGNHSGQSRR